ncbi:MAG: hypothetical protein A2052_05590 [Deltaproteobacteria bacterium GWA2_54_12]|nr:MAG: hypothetical protein A2052_05590 [Deltaproteobacteria bacterium GWA2_54_12]
MPDIEALAAKLFNDISGLPEERMRLALLCKTLSTLAPFDAARLLDTIYNKDIEDKSASIVRSLMVDDEAVHSQIGDGAYNSIYLAALRGGLTRISRLFTEFEPHKKGVSGYDEEEFIKMEHLTLGERRALSKSQLKKNIDMLLSDPDPIVIGNLLGNPRITEREILKIASKRPNSGRILKLIALHPKWSKRYEVAKAVALNPYTLPRISIALIEKMLTQDLSAISEDGTIHPEVRESAKDLLLDRKKKGKIH